MTSRNQLEGLRTHQFSSAQTALWLFFDTHSTPLYQTLRTHGKNRNIFNNKHKFTQSWETASDWSAVDERKWLFESADVRGGGNA